ncbi:MAG: apolipoprotein N-acyltransferase [Acidobacteriota bacterium]
MMKRFFTIAVISVLSGIFLAMPSFGGCFRYFSLVALVPWVILYHRFEKASIFAILIGSYVFWNIGFRGGFSFRLYIPPVLAIICFSQFLFFAILLKRVRRLALPLCLTIPLLWVSLEWFRVHFTLGHFVFYLLGYSLAPETRMIQIADLGGVYAVSFLLASVNGLIAEFLLSWFRRRENIGFILKRRLIASTLIVFFLVAATWLYGVARMGGRDWEEGPRITLLQPGIMHVIDNSVEVYLTQMLLTEREIGTGEVDLIVWPEYSIKAEIHKEPAYLEDLAWMAARKDASMLVGGFGEARKIKWKKTNTAFLLSKDGKIIGQYAKMILFPWGEYIPYDGLIGKISKGLQAMQRRAARGATGVEPFIEPGNDTSIMRLSNEGGESRFVMLLCHESIYPELAMNAKRDGADFIINMTSEGGVGQAIQRQVLYISVLRAVENKISILRDGNTGITAFIRPDGSIQSLLGSMEDFATVRGVLTDNVLIDNDQTVYSRVGDLFAWSCLGVSLFLFAMTFWKDLPIRTKGSLKIVFLLFLPLLLMICCQGGGAEKDDAASCIERGRNYIRENEQRKAFLEFVRATEIDPNASQTYAFIAKKFSTSELDEMGDEFFSKLKKRGADNAEFNFYYGFFKEALSDFKEAEESYRRAIEQKDDYILAHIKLADMYIKQGRNKDACNLLESYISRYGKHDAVMKYLASAEIHNENYVRGEEIIRDLLERNLDDRPLQAELYSLLGQSAFHQGNYREAKERFLESEDLDQNRPLTILYLGRIALRTGRLDLLEGEIEKARAIAKKKNENRTHRAGR